MSEFERIRRECETNGELWQDPAFPASQASVFYHETPPFQFDWRRPTELCPDPLFIRDDELDFNIGSGKLGDRWFVSCIGCLQTARGLFYRVVPADQSFGPGYYAGIFRFRIFWNGQWLEVLVDDRLPTVNGRLVFTCSLHGNVFWMSLLEKACAKLHGSYEALKYGSTMDGLADMTGGVAECFPLAEPNASPDRPHSSTSTRATLLSRLLRHSSLVTAVADGRESMPKMSSKSEVLRNGIMADTNYRLMRLESVSTKSGSVSLVLLHVCLLGSSRYSGPWASARGVCSCGSGRQCQWCRVPQTEKQRLSLDKLDDQLQFWMSLTDFCSTFCRLELVHLDQETARDEPTLCRLKTWHVKVYQGVWRRGVTAGGCRNNSDTFHTNPRLQLVVPGSELEEGEVQLLVSLCQHAVTEPRVVGFSVYQVPGEWLASGDQHGAASLAARLDAQFFRQHISVVNSQYTNGRQICQRCKLSAGFSFVVVPTTFEPGQEGQFTLRVFSDISVRLKLIDTPSLLLRNPLIKAPSSSSGKGFNQYEAVFQQLADEHKTVNVFELQELLDACLPNDYIKSCATLSVCRQVVFLMDSSGVGRLSFSQFKDLICSLKLWQNVFKNHTKEKAGVLRIERFREALCEAGVQLSTDVFGVLVQRYARKDGTLRFGDFVGALAQLCTAFDVMSRGDCLKAGSVTLSTAEWLRAALSC